MSNDRYVVAVNACVNAGNVDMIGYWMMNLKWRQMGLHMIRSHIKGNMEWKSTGSCYQVTSNGPGWFVRNMALTACQAIQKPASEIIRGCVSVYCVSPGWAAPWRSVCVISDLWQSPRIHGQYRHSIKPVCFSQRLWRLDRYEKRKKKKDDNYFSCFTWPNYLFLLWSFAGLLVGFFSLRIGVITQDWLPLLCSLQNMKTVMFLVLFHSKHIWLFWTALQAWQRAEWWLSGKYPLLVLSLPLLALA